MVTIGKKPRDSYKLEAQRRGTEPIFVLDSKSRPDYGTD